MNSKINTERLNTYIERSGLKKIHIADKMGIIPPRLSEKINGRIFMYPHELMDILGIIGMDDSEIDCERLTDWYIAEQTD